MLVDRAPQPVLLAVDRHHDLVEVPLVAARWRVRAKAPGNGGPELQRPASNCLVGHLDAACGQQLLDHAQAQRETEVQPDRVADDLRRKSVPAYEIGLSAALGDFLGVRAANTTCAECAGR